MIIGSIGLRRRQVCNRFTPATSSLCQAYNGSRCMYIIDSRAKRLRGWTAALTHVAPGVGASNNHTCSLSLPLAVLRAMLPPLSVLAPGHLRREMAQSLIDALQVARQLASHGSDVRAGYDHGFHAMATTCSHQQREHEVLSSIFIVVPGKATSSPTVPRGCH
eukprot:XP_001702808.1 predicted protein [Chlamydomonas reinhardtii]